MLEDDIVRHRKKKPSHTSKSNAKSKHKHSYVPAVFEHTEHYDIPEQGTRDATFREYGYYCNICGKKGKCITFLESKQIDEFKKQNPDVPTIVLNNYYRTKFVDLDKI